VKALMVRFLGRRAVSGAISGMFVVLIFVAAVSALLAYNTSLDRYNQAVSERNLMEWERLNEKIVISAAERVEEDGTLNATIQNIGAVTAHLVSLWLSAYDGNREPQWQQQYSIDIWMSPGEVKHYLGQNIYNYILIRPGQAGNPTTFVKLPNATWVYGIKIVTERGNAATYILQPPPREGAPIQFNGQPVPLIISFNQESFQYTTKGLYPVWKAAWVKPRGTTGDHQIYRVNVTNVSGKDIVLLSSSHMRQEADDGSDAEVVWWIVDPSTNPNGKDPKEFTTQTIKNAKWAYIYFAASSERGGSWQGDPTRTHYYTVFIHIFFHFEGENVYYGQTIGIMGQRLS